jgi:YVTN family beta-propeller protein
VEELPPATPSAPRPGRWSRWWVALIVGLLVAVLAGGGVLLYLNVRPSPRPATGSGGTASASAPASAPGSPPAGTATPTPVVANLFPASGGPPVSVGKSANFVAVAPNGQQLYVADPVGQQIVVVDTATNQVNGHIPISAGPPRFIAFGPAQAHRMYVSVWDDAKTIADVAVVDTTTNHVITTIPVDSKPMLPAVSPNGKWIFVPTHDTNAVAVVDAATNKVVKKFGVPPNPHSVSFTPDGSKAYIADHDSNLVTVVDTSTYATIKDIQVPSSPHNVAVLPDPNLHLAVVACYTANQAAVIDTNTNTVIKIVPVGREPQFVTFSADHRLAYVVNDDDNTISVIQLGKGADASNTGATIQTGRAPTSMAVVANGSKGYISNVTDGSLTLLNLG